MTINTVCGTKIEYNKPIRYFLRRASCVVSKEAVTHNGVKKINRIRLLPFAPYEVKVEMAARFFWRGHHSELFTWGNALNCTSPLHLWCQPHSIVPLCIDPFPNPTLHLTKYNIKDDRWDSYSEQQIVVFGVLWFKC